MGQAQSYCGSGITVRALRLPFCDELNWNAHLFQAVENAAGGDLFQGITAAVMKGQGTDMRLIGQTASGEAATLRLDVQISPPKEDGVIDDDIEPVVRSNRTGATRRVTIAPEAWFRHSGNARQAENALTFELIMGLASPSLRSVLSEGIDRVTETYDEIKRPKRVVPLWVWTHRWWSAKPKVSGRSSGLMNC